MEEKRKYSRLRVENKKATLKQEWGTDDVPLIDLSSGGMRVLLNKEIALGERLVGEFQITPKLGSYFVEGKVIWKRDTPETDGSEVGIKFERINTISCL